MGDWSVERARKSRRESEVCSLYIGVVHPGVASDVSLSY